MLRFEKALFFSPLLKSNLSVNLTLFRMDFFRAAQGWGWGTLPKICNTYPAMMKLGSFTLPKEDPKNI